MSISKVKQVFVTVGTTDFDSLLKSATSTEVLITLAALGFERILLQIGRGQFEPASSSVDGIRADYYQYKNSLQSDLQTSDLILSHAGAGTCLEVLELGKPLVVVINEALHDNHQLELAKQLASEGFLFYCVPETLEKTLREADFNSLRPWIPGNPEIFAKWLDKYLGFEN